MKHIVLLGDSIFDNQSYVGGGKDTIANLREQMPADWTATLLAVDGSVADGVARQLDRIPSDASHLFVSVGGNDALREMDILQMRASSAVEVFNELSNVSARFEHRYKQMLDSVLKLNRPTTVCTIYYPRFPEPERQKLSVAALATFNDVITRQAFLAGVPLIDLRYVCDDDADYANPIEPSEAGGANIASTIIQVVNEHSFEANKTSVFAGSDAGIGLAAICLSDEGLRKTTAGNETSESGPIRVDFLSSETFPFLNRLGMIYAPGNPLIEEDEIERLQLDEILESDDVAVMRLQGPKDRSLPESVEEVVSMVLDFEKGPRYGGCLLIHCKDNQRIVAIIAACLAVAATDAELSAREALSLVRDARAETLETEEQQQFVAEFEKAWRELMARPSTQPAVKKTLGRWRTGKKKGLGF